MTTSIVPYNMYEALSAYQRLQAQLSMDNLEMAVMEINTFQKMYPDVAMAHNDLGVMYLRIGNKLLALAHYEKANRLQPGDLTFTKNLAEFYAVELGWLDDAIVMLTALLKQYPEDVELLAALGSISEQIGRKEEARIFYRRILDLEPANSGAREAIARLGQPAMANVEPAVVIPVQQVRQEPSPTVEGGGNLQDILARLRATVQATTSEAAQAQPGQEAMYAEAQRLVASGEDDRAIEALERLTGLYPNYALAYNDLGVLYIRKGNFPKACYYEEMAVAKSPTNVTFRKNLADLYYAGEIGRTDDAIRIYTELLKEYPADVEVLSALAMICEANNLHDQARTFIRKVLDLEPWNAAARDFLAGIN